MKTRTFFVMLCLTLTFFGCSSEQRAQKQIHKGLELKELERYEEAIDAFHEAIRIKPDLAEAHYELGGVYFKQRSFNEAIKCYQQAIRLKPDNPEAYFNMGLAYINLQQWNDVIESFTQAAHLKPDKSGRAYFYIGEACHQLQDYKGAIAAFQKSIDLQPEFSKAYKHLGASYGALEHWGEASKALQEAVRLDPSDAEADTLLAYCQAILDYNKKVTADPAYSKLSEYGYNRISIAFANASANFQYLISKYIMTYGDFLKLPLDQQITKCNELRNELGIDELRWSLALQEWLYTDARIATTIASY